MQTRKVGTASSVIASATFVIVLMTAAGVFTLYTGVIPVAKITQTTSLISTATLVTTLPAQVVSVTQTTTATTTHTTTATTTMIVTNTSMIASLQALLNLSNKTVLLNNFKVKIGPAIPCPYASNCFYPNSTEFFSFQVPYAGFVLITATSSPQYSNPSLRIQYNYYSLANGIGCGLNTQCSDGWIYISPYNAANMLAAVLPGKVTFTAYNYSNQTITITLSAWYYS